MDGSPRKWRVWEKGTFTPWGKIFDFPSQGKIYLKPFFCLGLFGGSIEPSRGFSRTFFSSASKYRFQSVIFRWGISRAQGSSLGTSPCTRAKVTLVRRSQTQQNKGKHVSSSWKAPRTAPGRNKIPLLLCYPKGPAVLKTLWRINSRSPY